MILPQKSKEQLQINESQLRLVGDEKTSEMKEMAFSTLDGKNLVEDYLGKDIVLTSLNNLEEIREKDDLSELGTGDGTVSMYPLNIFDADFDEEALDDERMNPHATILEIFEDMSEYPGVYIPIQMRNAGGTVKPVLPEDYVEILYMMSDPESYPRRPESERFEHRTGWYDGVVAGITSAGDILVYSWKHGVQRIKRKTLKDETSIKVGQQVQIGMGPKKDSGSTVHLSASIDDTHDMLDVDQLISQGDLLTKFPLKDKTKQEDNTKNKEKKTKAQHKPKKKQKNKSNKVKVQKKPFENGLTDKEFARNKSIVNEIMGSLDLNKVGFNYRVDPLTLSYLPELSKRDARPGTRVVSASGAPGIIKSRKEGDTKESDRVKVAYFREDNAGNKRQSVARTKISNLKKGK